MSFSDYLADAKGHLPLLVYQASELPTSIEDVTCVDDDFPFELSENPQYILVSSDSHMGPMPIYWLARVCARMRIGVAHISDDALRALLGSTASQEPLVAIWDYHRGPRHHRLPIERKAEA